MAVYDIAGGLKTAEPVSNFYQGKAIRLALERDRLTNEAQSIQNEQADDVLDIENRKVSTSEGNLAMRQREYMLNAQKFAQEVGEENAAQYAQDLFGRITAVDKAVTEGEIGEDEALAKAAESFTEYAQNLPPQYAEPILAKLQDGLTIDEYRQIKAANAAGLKQYGLLEDEKSSFEQLLSETSLSEKEKEKLRRANLRKSTSVSEGNKPTAKEEEIKRYMDLGYDKETATKAAYDKLNIDINQATGRLIQEDELEGTAKEITMSGEEVPAIGPEPGKTLWDLSEYATGPTSAAKAALNVPLAWAGLPTDQKVTSARQTFKTTNQNFIRALAINQRFPLGEQERIREEIALLPAILDSPSLLRDRMLSIRDDLTIRMRQAAQDAENPDLPQKIRERQGINATEIKNYLALIGAPPPFEDIPDIVKNSGNVAAYENMTPAAREEYLEILETQRE